MGAILFEETLYQSGSTGTPFVDTLNSQGIIPGIKVDKGLVPMSNSNGESWCQGLDGLAERCAEYYKQGARFAKWRSVVNIAAGPSDKDLMFEGILLKPSMVTPGADSGTKLAPE